MSEDPIILECNSVQIEPGSTELNFQLPANKLCCVLGPVDSGKSQNLRVLGAVDPPVSGELFILKHNYWQLSETEQRQIHKQACYVLPNIGLLSSASIQQNIAIPALYHKIAKQDDVRKRVAWLLEWFNIEADPEQLPGYLPEPQKRLVAIARCLILQPKLLFIDEPFAQLDTAGIEDMTRKCLEIQQEFHTTLVVATHHATFASEYADIIVLMHSGGPRVYTSWSELTNDNDTEVRNYLMKCKLQ